MIDVNEQRPSRRTVLGAMLAVPALTVPIAEAKAAEPEWIDRLKALLGERLPPGNLDLSSAAAYAVWAVYAVEAAHPEMAR